MGNYGSRDAHHFISRCTEGEKNDEAGGPGGARKLCCICADLYLVHAFS